MKKLFIYCICMALKAGVCGQVNRAVFSVMVVPYADGDDEEKALQALETVPGYKEAISGISSTLINMGYRNMLDLKTAIQAAKDRRLLTTRHTTTGDMKAAIEHAPADILIEAQVEWINPPDNPRNRQAKLLLRAVDKYTTELYATSAGIQSEQREYPNMASAVSHAIAKNDSAELKRFLAQLDQSYARLLQEGRDVKIKFEVGNKSNAKLTDRVGDDRLADKLEDFVQQISHKKYRQVGASADYIDFVVRVPVFDETGSPVSPNLFLRRKVDDYFYKLGFDVDYLVIDNWIDFILLQRRVVVPRTSISTKPLDNAFCYSGVNYQYSQCCFDNKTGHNLTMTHYFGFWGSPVTDEKLSAPDGEITCTGRLLVGYYNGEAIRNFRFYFQMENGVECPTPITLTLKKCEQTTITLTKANLGIKD